jgi:pilus assembly protein CpaC
VLASGEILINAVALGTTTLIYWDRQNLAHIFSIEVTVDAQALERQIRDLFPNVNVTVTTTGNNVILSGAVSDATVVRRIQEIAAATGANVINNLQAPTAEQVLLQVRFAEVNRSAMQNLGTQLAVLNPDRLEDAVKGDVAIETISDGIVRLFMLGGDSQLQAFIRAAKSTGDFRDLAEPNLLTLEGKEASFLAGGEFPYPAVQTVGAGGSSTNAITVQFREFGVRLRFTPFVTNAGAIRLQLAPEVSSLDFANGVTISGFQLPSILTRRAETEVELKPGQHLAIAGLLDTQSISDVDKIPLLGDIPILGTLFRSKNIQQRRTELLVLVTPRLVRPSDVPPPLPTGEPGTWKLDRSLRVPRDTTGAVRR